MRYNEHRPELSICIQLRVCTKEAENSRNNQMTPAAPANNEWAKRMCLSSRCTTHSAMKQVGYRTDKKRQLCLRGKRLRDSSNR